MPEKCSSSNKGVFSAVVRDNRQIGQRFYRLGLEFSGAAAKAFANFRPGQFVQMDVSGVALPPAERIPEELSDAAHREILLRRPFSFADVTVKQDRTRAEILYCVVGPATLRMTTLTPGDSLSVIGPLGNGFRIPKGKTKALLVIGGMGAPPLQHLAKVLTVEPVEGGSDPVQGFALPDIEVTAFAGAKTAKELPFGKELDSISRQLGFSLPEFAKYGVKSMVATDDGSAGFAGPVTDYLVQWFNDRPGLARDSVIIYACGPEAMLARVAQIAREKRIDCQLSMERRMACGIGVCQSCAVECRVEGSTETVYKLCCEDGPVFDSSEVVF